MSQHNNYPFSDGYSGIDGFETVNDISDGLEFDDFSDAPVTAAFNHNTTTSHNNTLRLPSVGSQARPYAQSNPSNTDSFAYPGLSVIGQDEGQTVVPASQFDLSRDNAKYQSKSRRRGKRIRAVLGAIIIVLLAYGCFQLVKGMFKEDLNQRIQGGTNATEVGNTKEALTPMVSTDPFYMMLIGSDSRNDDENERSDTNIVARIDPQSGTVNLISIPRDTAINLEGYGTQKFNAAYAYYGTEGAIKAAEGLLGIKISHYAEVDFAGMVELVNAMGGVDVDVPMRIEDANAGDKIIEAGMQHLDGEQALIFARSRSYVNGDFQRTANQRILLGALLDKLMTLNKLQLAPVMSAAADYLTSDMTVDQMQDYAILMQNHEQINMYSVMVPSDVTMANEVSYVVCDTELLRQVMEVVSQGGDPSSLVNDSSVFSSAEAEEMGATSTPIYVPD